MSMICPFQLKNLAYTQKPLQSLKNDVYNVPMHYQTFPWVRVERWMRNRPFVWRANWWIQTMETTVTGRRWMKICLVLQRGSRVSQKMEERVRNIDEPCSFILLYTHLFLLFYHFLYIADPPPHTPPLQPHAQCLPSLYQTGLAYLMDRWFMIHMFYISISSYNACPPMAQPIMNCHTTQSGTYYSFSSDKPCAHFLVYHSYTTCLYLPYHPRLPEYEFPPVFRFSVSTLPCLTHFPCPIVHCIPPYLPVMPYPWSLTPRLHSQSHIGSMLRLPAPMILATSLAYQCTIEVPDSKSNTRAKKKKDGAAAERLTPNETVGKTTEEDGKSEDVSGRKKERERGCVAVWGCKQLVISQCIRSGWSTNVVRAISFLNKCCTQSTNSFLPEPQPPFRAKKRWSYYQLGHYCLCTHTFLTHTHSSTSCHPSTKAVSQWSTSKLGAKNINLIMIQVWNLTGVPCQTMMKPLEMNEMLLSIALQRMLQIQYAFLIILLQIYSHIL